MTDTTKLTKTAVRRHTAELRRTAAELQQLVDKLDTARHNGGAWGDGTLRGELDARHGTRSVISNMLGDLDGISAQLRELLAVDL